MRPRKGSSARGPSRRPVQFWKPFNDWWRTALEKEGKRPTAEEINSWYSENASSVWGDAGPSMQDTRVHAKCLRSVDAVRLYFRKYREVKKVEQCDKLDEEATEDEVEAPVPKKPRSARCNLPIKPEPESSRSCDKPLGVQPFQMRQPCGTQQPARHFSQTLPTLNGLSPGTQYPACTPFSMALHMLTEPMQSSKQHIPVQQSEPSMAIPPFMPYQPYPAYHPREMSIHKPPLSAAAKGLGSKQSCKQAVPSSHQLGVPIADISRIKVSRKPTPGSASTAPDSVANALPCASPLGLMMSALDDESLESLDLTNLLSDQTPTYAMGASLTSPCWTVGSAKGRSARKTMHQGPADSQRTVDYTNQQPGSSSSHGWPYPNQQNHPAYAQFQHMGMGRPSTHLPWPAPYVGMHPTRPYPMSPGLFRGTRGHAPTYDPIKQPHSSSGGSTKAHQHAREHTYPQVPYPSSHGMYGPHAWPQHRMGMPPGPGSPFPYHPLPPNGPAGFKLEQDTEQAIGFRPFHLSVAKIE